MWTCTWRPLELKALWLNGNVQCRQFLTLKVGYWLRAAAMPGNVHCFASPKLIPCCRARTWRVLSQIGAVLCPAAKGFQCAVFFQLRQSCVWGTASTAACRCRASMLNTNMVNKWTSFSVSSDATHFMVLLQASIHMHHMQCLKTSNSEANLRT
jgi:hypothetical protein